MAPNEATLRGSERSPGIYSLDQCWYWNKTNKDVQASGHRLPTSNTVIVMRYAEVSVVKTKDNVRTAYNDLNLF